MQKILIISLIATAMLIGLLVWASTNRTTNFVTFEDTDIACLANGHQSIFAHIHMGLEITVDDQPEIIPANVGINSTCMSELHTHDETGEIHVETVSVGRLDELTLTDFFAVWNKSSEREGYTLEITQDGEIINSVEEVKFRDGSVVKMSYISNEETLIE